MLTGRKEVEFLICNLLLLFHLCVTWVRQLCHSRNNSTLMNGDRGNPEVETGCNDGSCNGGISSTTFTGGQSIF